jgi:hypothetical protein
MPVSRARGSISYVNVSQSMSATYHNICVPELARYNGGSDVDKPCNVNNVKHVTENDI